MRRHTTIAGAATTHISAIDTERMLSIVANDALEPIAADAKRRLGAVVSDRQPADVTTSH